MNLLKPVLIVLASSFSLAHAQIDHSQMKHTQSPQKNVLSEAGTDPFATIQEAIVALEADENTNWQLVNIEALRKHLVQMHDMTMNVSVVQKNQHNGLLVTVTPTTIRASKSLQAVFAAHPAQLKRETGWEMKVSHYVGNFMVEITANTPDDVIKIQGLGYIGVMAYGNHHQPHHWAMASGSNPHSNHNMQH